MADPLSASGLPLKPKAAPAGLAVAALAEHGEIAAPLP
jgi:hypothetical protein